MGQYCAYHCVLILYKPKMSVSVLVTGEEVLISTVVPHLRTRYLSSGHSHHFKNEFSCSQVLSTLDYVSRNRDISKS